MVTHGGRCPYCQNRTTPGVGSRAGYWICVPCKTVFDNYGQIKQGGPPASAPAPAGAIEPAAPTRKGKLWIIPPIQTQPEV